MNGAAFPGAGGGTKLCLDALAYARRVFGVDDAHWCETPALLAAARPLLQGLRPDWLAFPLREWAAAWWQPRHPPPAAKPLRTLKARLADEAFVAALLDALRALHSVAAPATGLALQIDDPAHWLAWALGEDEADDDIDDGDAEDVMVCLAALLHRLAGSGIGAVLVRQSTPTSADIAERCAALTNAAVHHGWSAVLCSAGEAAPPAGFDALATSPPAGGLGVWVDDRDWGCETTTAAPFVVARVPAQATPDTVLAQIAHWRGTR